MTGSLIESKPDRVYTYRANRSAIMPIRAVSFAEHQEAKRQSRQRDADDIASGRRSLQEVAQANGGIAAFVRPKSMKLVRRPLLSARAS